MAKRNAITYMYQLSKEGLRALRTQLAQLQRDFGSLREKLAQIQRNNDFEDFDLVDDKTQLAFLEKEIQRITFILSHYQLFDKKLPSTQTVQLGSKVHLETDNGQHIRCILVSAVEVDPNEGKISDQSPLGSALLGKAVNSFVEVVAPRARKLYKIVGIEA